MLLDNDAQRSETGNWYDHRATVKIGEKGFNEWQLAVEASLSSQQLFLRVRNRKRTTSFETKEAKETKGAKMRETFPATCRRRRVCLHSNIGLAVAAN